MFPRVRTQKRMFPLQGGVFSNHFSIGLPNVNFMKRRNDYGGVNMIANDSVNAQKNTINNAPVPQINVLSKSPYQEIQPQNQRQANPYPDIDISKREYGYRAQDMPSIENFGNEVDYRYLEDFPGQQYVLNPEDVKEKYALSDQRMSKEEALNNEILLRNYREYDKNMQADQEIREAQRLHKEPYEEDLLPKDLQYEFPISTNKPAIDSFEPKPEPEAAPMEERRDLELRKSPARLYKEELDRQIILKQELQKEADKISRSLDMETLRKAKAEEDKLNQEKLEKKKRMQQMAKEEYEYQMQGRRGYRGMNALGYRNSIQEPVTEDIEAKKLPNIPDSFGSIHEANREKFKLVLLMLHYSD